MQPLQNNQDLFEAKKKGIIGSIIIHIALFILLILVTFSIHQTIPVHAEEGLLVNFGFDETGDGLFEPAPSSTPPPSVAPVKTKGDENDEEAVVTQDNEEAPAVKKADPDALRKKQEAIAAENKKREDAEADRVRKELEKAERLKKEEQQKKLNEISNRTRNAFGNPGNTGTSGTSEGIAGGTGNQGVPTGTPGVRNYGPGGGTGNAGVSFSLAGRKNQTLPVPKYDYQDEGVVVVEVTVDKSGVVTKAVPGVKGSTTLDEYLLKAARDAALKARFDSNVNAPVIQKGTITYNFKLK